MLKLLFKPLEDLALFIGSRAWTRRLARWAMKPFKLKKDIRIQVGDDAIYVNSIDRLAAALLWKHSLLSGLEARVYRERVKPGMTVLEIGANIGFFTLLFSKLAGTAGRVIAFEPDPGNFRLLEKSVGASGAKNTRCVRKAVSDRTGAGLLFRSEEHHGDHRIFSSADGRDSVEIQTAAIDDLFTSGERVDFIKMDIQGAEYSALLGMERTILRSGPLTMLCEFSPGMLRTAGADPAAFLNRLLALGFTLKYLDGNAGALKAATPGELLRLCPGDRYLNLLLEKN